MQRPKGNFHEHSRRRTRNSLEHRNEDPGGSKRSRRNDDTIDLYDRNRYGCHESRYSSDSEYYRSRDHISRSQSSDLGEERDESVQLNKATSNIAKRTTTEKRRKEPVAVEELQKRLEMEKKIGERPVFVSRKDREKVALERLSALRSQQKRENIYRKDKNSSGEGEEDRVHIREHRDASPRSYAKDIYRPEKRNKDRYSSLKINHSRSPGANPRSVAKTDHRHSMGNEPARSYDEELEAIRKTYMKEKEVKGRMFRPSEKMRFRFDWDDCEDTGKDSISKVLSNTKYQPSLSFGKGKLAGFDPNEYLQKLSSSDRKRADKDSHRNEYDKGVSSSVVDVVHRKSKKMHDERHWSEKSREEMTERDWRIFREDHSIAVRGGGNILPARCWIETGLPSQIINLIENIAKYKEPSPIQMAAIPIGLRNRDMIGLAETGSGKTAAFVLPMLVYISKQPPMTATNAAEGPYAIIMAPTRELAQQIESETRKFADALGYKVCSVVGGLSIEAQGTQLRAGCEIVIATPGRMLDCLDRSFCVLNQCNYIVLDEADRMIDMGFEPQVQEVLNAMPSTNIRPEEKDENAIDIETETNILYRQTFMFSATMPPAVERLAKKFMRKPVIVAVGETGKASQNVEQIVEFMSESKKKERLIQLLRMCEPPIIVFVNTKKGCDAVSRMIEADVSIRPIVLHSGKSQEVREESLEGFRNGKYSVLVATDVLGRGIDIKGVNHVINYELPGKIENYTHRIGRTGRAGKTGTAWSFVTSADSDLFFDLKVRLQESGAKVPPEIARSDASKSRPGEFFGQAIVD